MKKIYLKIIAIIIAVCLIFSGLIFISYLNSSDYLVDNLYKLYTTHDFDKINKVYGDFFEKEDYKQILMDSYEDSYNENSFPYETKYLVSLLATNQKDKFVDYFTMFIKNLSNVQVADFIQQLYDAINTDTQKDYEMHVLIVAKLNETENDFEELALNSYFASMLCFLNYSVENNEKSEFLFKKIQNDLGEDFEEFWDKECVKYCGSLLLKRIYDRFEVVLLKAYNNELNLTTSIATMINQLGCDNEQLQVLSKSLKKLSNVFEDENKRKSFEILSELAIG